MTIDQWQTAWRIFNVASELPIYEQRRFVEAQSVDTEILRRVFDELESLRQAEDVEVFVPFAPEIERAGSLVGRYRVGSLLGRGGIGEVYSAQDTDLDRAVALKFLRSESIGDSGAVRRFVREGKAASALNHPNIVTVHEVIDSPSGLAIVMELIAGQPMNELRGLKLTLRQVMQIGTQVASALATAHEGAIVHRDIKPENLILRPDGVVKVLDFGLARSLAEETASAFQSSVTGFAGTLRYMSPEQLRHERLTGASDIYSLGLVLYEFIAGRHPFESSYAWEIAHAIHTRDAQTLLSANGETPEWLNELIGSMLSRDAALRPTAREVELALSRELRDRRPVRVNSSLWKVAAPALMLSAVVTLIWFLSRVLPLSEPSAIAFTHYPGDEDMASFSPDGHSVAFTWNGPAQDNFDIYVRKVGSPALRRVTSSPLEDYSPVWSPDGESIAFLRKSVTSDFAVLLVIPAQGGREKEITRISTYFREPIASLSWTPDGNWLVAPQQEPFGLFLISVRDGTKRRLTRPPDDQSDLLPAVSPDGRAVAFVRGYAEGLPSVYLLPLTPGFLSGGEPQPVPGFFNVGLYSPQWTADGKELLFVANPYKTGMAIWRIRVPEPGKPMSSPQKIYATRSTRTHLAAPSGVAQRVIYTKEIEDRNIWMTPLGIAGATGQARRVVPASRNNSDAHISPDGSRIVYQSNQSGSTEIWASNLDGTHTVQLTNFGGAGTGSAVWAPDGRRIAFDSRVEGRPHIYLISATGGRPERLTDGLADNYLPAWSRDGCWLYYSSTRSGTVEVWRQQATGGPAEQITHQGGWSPAESPDGRSLFYQKRVPAGWSLRRRILATGVDTEILPTITERAFAIARDGVYYVPLPGPDGGFTIQFHSFESNASRLIARIWKPMSRPLSLAPDGSFLLYSQLDRVGQDLMLIENFR